MKLLDAKINIFFKDINETPEFINGVIENLKKSYRIANLSSVTGLGGGVQEGDIPNDIPRIIGKTHGNHTQLNISLNRIEIYTNFDVKYASDIEKCIEYVKCKVSEVHEVMRKFVGGKYLFSGITITQIFDELEEDPVKRIIDNFVSIKSKEQPYNISSKFTYVKDETNFININIFNARGIENIETGMASQMPKKFNHLSITFDVNDRYGFNEIPNYLSNYEKIVENIELSKRLCEKESYHLIEGKELEL